MAYSSGVANNPTDVLNALTTLATANGWTLTSGVLSKGTKHFRITAAATTLKIEMGTAAGFASPGITGNAFPFIAFNNVWPVFYKIFITDLNGADTVIVQVLEANAIEYKYMMFGNLENKVGATWQGGEWMHATYGSLTSGSMVLQSNAGIDIIKAGASSDGVGGDDAENYTQGHGGLFMQCDGMPNFGGNFIGGNTFIRCDIDGGTFRINKNYGVGVDNFLGCVDAMRWMRLPLIRQPNTWNGESVLVPFHVFLGRATSTRARLGTVGHIRAMRMDNYEPGDVITLGTDRWIVFPMYLRDQTLVTGKASAFNNAGINGHSGQLAYAIKYDGP